jgi:hypothetical protein
MTTIDVILLRIWTAAPSAWLAALVERMRGQHGPR